MGTIGVKEGKRRNDAKRCAGKPACLVVPLAISLANGPENAIFVNAAFGSQRLTKGRTGWESDDPLRGYPRLKQVFQR
jgi:hypothetical protein